MSVGTWVAIVVPLIGFFGTVVTVIASRRQERATATKTSAEALQVIQESTLNLLEPQQNQINELRKENTQLRGAVRDLNDRMDAIEDDRDLLADAMKVQVEWQDSGRLDPPGAPPIKAKVRMILDRLHAA